MARVLDGSNNRLAVVIHTPQLNAVAMFVGVKKRIGCLETRCDGIADAPQIDRTDPAYLAIERNMGVPDHDQVRIAARQPALQLNITVRGLETRSIISSWGSMNAKQARAIR